MATKATARTRAASLAGMTITWTQCRSTEGAARYTPQQFKIDGETLAMVLANLAERIPAGDFKLLFDPTDMQLDVEGLADLVETVAESDNSDYEALGPDALHFTGRVLRDISARLAVPDGCKDVMKSARVRLGKEG
jgi:hypothetical protein